MLYFIKGQGTSEYLELISLKEEYRESIYLDELANILYYDGKPTDVKVEEVITQGDDYVMNRTFVFTRPDDSVVRIEDAEIPNITDLEIVLHDVSTGVESRYKNGLISVKDKFTINAISKLLGITTEYTYWATVHHVKDTDNGEYVKTTGVTVYKNENDMWQYDYDGYEKIYIDQATGEETETIIVPAGSQELTPDIRVYRDREGNIYEIDGQEEIDSVTASSISLVRNSNIFTLFDGGDRPDDQVTLEDFGGIKKGTSIAELEQVTVSEVVAKLLFRDASLNPKEETQSYIKFTDNYIRTNGITKEDSIDGVQYIEIGAPYPLLEDFETVFVPDTWQLEVDGKPVGEPQILQEWINTSYYINDKQHPWDAHGHHDDSHPEDHWDIYPVLDYGGYMEHYNNYRITDGDESVYYGIIHFQGIANAKDQYGHETYVDDEGHVHYYKRGESGEVQSTNYLCFTGEEYTTNPTYRDQDVSLIYSLAPAWRIYSNATESYNDEIIAWDSRNIEPEMSFVEDSKNPIGALAINGRPVYLKWNSHTKHYEHFYVYLPDNITIENVAAAHDGANYEWSARCNHWQVYDEETELPKKVEITNRFNVTSLYNVYEIQKSAGITNVRLYLKSSTPNN